jgi:hypothetical protein
LLPSSLSPPKTPENQFAIDAPTPSSSSRRGDGRSAERASGVTAEDARDRDDADGGFIGDAAGDARSPPGVDGTHPPVSHATSVIAAERRAVMAEPPEPRTGK